MSLGAQTVVVDGQRFAVPTTAAYNPYGFAQLTQPQPLSNVNFPPVLPNGVPGGGGSGFSNVGGYGTAEQNSLVASNANANPWDLKASPTWWTIIFLVFAVFVLSAVHWRKTTLAGADANLHVGPAEGAGEVSV
jgi:hypothetical protein